MGVNRIVSRNGNFGSCPLLGFVKVKSRLIPAFRGMFGMRLAIVSLLLAGAIAPAAAQGITIDGVARSASLMRELGTTCAGTFDVDRDIAGRYEKAFVEAGEKSYGKAAFDRALAQEYPRRAREVRAAGSDRWCAEQRDRMRALGSGGAELFRK